jgi:hypothetical protein
MFCFSIKTVIVLSGLRTIVVLLSIGPATEVDDEIRILIPELKDATNTTSDNYPQFPKKPAKGHSATQ